jgi:hypothetical protein
VTALGGLKHLLRGAETTGEDGWLRVAEPGDAWPSRERRFIVLTVDPYDLLGVQRTATPAEVVAAYEHVAEIFDPSRWAASPELAREATAWAEAIEGARRTILQDR